MKCLFAFALVALFYSNAGLAQYSANADAKVEVKEDISINSVRDLEFGQAARNAGPATIDPASDDTNSAEFAVSGAPNTEYSVTLPSNVVMTLNGSGGGTSNTEINVSGFTFYSETTALTTAAQLGAGGSDALRIGAQRDPIDADETIGSYQGTFTVTVAY